MGEALPPGDWEGVGKAGTAEVPLGECVGEGDRLEDPEMGCKVLLSTAPEGAVARGVEEKASSVGLLVLLPLLLVSY